MGYTQHVGRFGLPYNSNPRQLTIGPEVKILKNSNLGRTSYRVHPTSLQTLIGVPILCILIDTSLLKANESKSLQFSEIDFPHYSTGK
jgi:hypothetical protein